MADRSSLPPPSKATSYILNYSLYRENKALHLELEGIKDSNKICREEMQALREDVDKTLSTHQHALNSTVAAADERRGAEIQAMRDEMKAARESHSQDLARAFKENDGKRGVENQLLRSGMEALQSRYEEMSERVRALENNAKQGSRATNRPHKKPRTTTSITQKPTHTTTNGTAPPNSSSDPITLTGEGAPQPKPHPQATAPATSNLQAGEGAPQTAAPANGNPVPIIQAIQRAPQPKPHPQAVVSAISNRVLITRAGEGAPQSKPHPHEAAPASGDPVPVKQAVKRAPQPKPQPQTAPCATPSEMNTSATIFAATAIVLVPAPHFHNGHIHQGTMTLQDYTAAYAHHLSSIRAADAGESVNVSGPAEREAIVKFIRGMRENRDRRRITEDLETARLAVIDRSRKEVGVKFLCGWAVVEEVLGGWEKRGSGEGMEGRM
ncbi:hypothetical protein V493_05190 [Pseudogymnoascus sp. VKM F-4281 (FW-2241)]|nr:hypothetical protein V493_05190 [Pseudogymnoascus sp. VKM F-4281 (FW-2241)]